MPVLDAAGLSCLHPLAFCVVLYTLSRLGMKFPATIVELSISPLILGFYFLESGGPS